VVVVGVSTLVEDAKPSCHTKVPPQAMELISTVFPSHIVVSLLAKLKSKVGSIITSNASEVALLQLLGAQSTMTRIY